MSPMRKTVLCLLGAACMYAAVAAAEEHHLKVDSVHVRTWNAFAQACLDLHKQLITSHPVRTTSSVGGYVRMPKFYKQVDYYDKATGKLISQVQWEREHPDRLHTIEVYVRDAQGRVLRDYAAAYLPGGRNAPVQTLINLHGHNGGLNSFRQFDASGDKIYEYCDGTYAGKKVQIRLFEDDLFGNDPQMEKLMASDVYASCFKGVPETAGKYLKPQ